MLLAKPSVEIYQFITKNWWCFTLVDGADPEYIKYLYPTQQVPQLLSTPEKRPMSEHFFGVDISKRSIETLAEQAQAQGKSAGVVSSVPFSHDVSCGCGLSR